MMTDTICLGASRHAFTLLHPCSKSKHLPHSTSILNCQPLVSLFLGQQSIAKSNVSMRIMRKQLPQPLCLAMKSPVMELTQEACPREDYRRLPAYDYKGANPSTSWPPPNRADMPNLHNPLRRLERMGCGWLGVIFELEGVIADDDPELEKQAWLTLSQEEGKSPPPAFVLRRIEGMKSEQVMSEVLCWSRDPSELQRLAARKEEIHRSLRGGSFYQTRAGSREFMAVLANYKIPIAVVSVRPRRILDEAIEALAVRGYLAAVVAAEDVYRGKPDPEMFLCAAQLLSLIPERCIVFGTSNTAVEAAHDARMKCVAVASRRPVFELNAADLVVKRLDELSVVDLKNLADIDSAEFQSPEPEPEMELEHDEDDAPKADLDLFW